MFQQSLCVFLIVLVLDAQAEMLAMFSTSGPQGFAKFFHFAQEASFRAHDAEVTPTASRSLLLGG